MRSEDGERCETATSLSTARTAVFLTPALTMALTMIVTLAISLVLFSSPLLAQDGPDFEPEDAAGLFGTEFGDSFSSIFLNEIFGPLFPSAAGGNVETIFSSIIGYFNILILVVGGLLFFYNVTVGLLQSAHEGQVLGQRWSSLWAPLRVLFAVGLLVPVPNMGGYNLAQTGVAYIVKGATNFASTVWGGAVELIIEENVGITTAAPNVDTDLIEIMYENAACMEIVNHQLRESTPEGEEPPRVAYVPFSDFSESTRASEVQRALLESRESAAERADRESANVFRTGIVDSGGNLVDGGNDGSRPDICGSYRLPTTPAILDRVNDDDALETMPDSVKDQLITQYEQAHHRYTLSLIDRMQSITAANLDVALDSTPDLPSFSNEIATEIIESNEALGEDVDNLIETFSGADREADFAREEMLRRATGNEGCSQGQSSEDGPATCYGEGWIGAGSWYLMLVRLNNEISSLTEGSVSAETGTYIEDVPSESRHLYNVSSGDAFESGDMIVAEEAKRVKSRYMEMFTKSTQGLAALGFPLSTDSSAEFRASGNTSVANLVERMDLRNHIERWISYVIEFASPGNWASDPMLGLTEIGKWWLKWVAGALIGLGLSGFVPGVNTTAATLIMLGLSFPSIIAMAILVYILPLLPFFFWVIAVTAYFLLVVEAVIAVNLWAISHMRMDGEGISGDAGSRGWLLLLSLFLTPVLMLFGLFIGMTIFRVTSSLIDVGIYHAMLGIVGTDFIQLVFGFFFYPVMIVLMYIVLLERSFSLITEFPGKVLSWINVTAQLDGEGTTRGRAVALAAGYSAQRAQPALQQGIGGVGKLQQRYQDWRGGDGVQKKDSGGTPKGPSASG